MRSVYLKELAVDENGFMAYGTPADVLMDLNSYGDEKSLVWIGDVAWFYTGNSLRKVEDLELLKTRYSEKRLKHLFYNDEGKFIK